MGGVLHDVVAGVAYEAVGLRASACAPKEQILYTTAQQDLLWAGLRRPDDAAVAYFGGEGGGVRVGGSRKASRVSILRFFVGLRLHTP